MKTLFLSLVLLTAGCATTGPMSRGNNEYAERRACLSRATTFHTRNICEFGVAMANELQSQKLTPNYNRQFVETRKASYED